MFYAGFCAALTGAKGVFIDPKMYIFDEKRFMKVSPNKPTKKLQPWFNQLCHDARWVLHPTSK